MIILNTTFAIPTNSYKETMEWITQNLIPAIKKDTDIEHRLFFIHSQGNEDEDRSVSLQLEFANRDKINAFLESQNNNMIEAVTSKYNNKVLTFQTLLEELS